MTRFTDKDIEHWAAEDEKEEGYDGAWAGEPMPAGGAFGGRPVTVGENVRPFTLRLDEARRAKLDELANAQHITVSELIRDLIDAA